MSESMNYKTCPISEQLLVSIKTFSNFLGPLRNGNLKSIKAKANVRQKFLLVAKPPRDRLKNLDSNPKIKHLK